MIEITTKDSSGFKEYQAGEKGGTFQFEGLLEYDTSVATQGLSFTTSSPTPWLVPRSLSAGLRSQAATNTWKARYW
jgi:hypothetical protein